MLAQKLKPGTRIRVTQTIHRREGDWHTAVTGEVLTFGQEKTGSWYAHSPKGKLMLGRIRLRKDDGELTTITLDERSRVELLEDTTGD
jgi:hypothetical protein